MPKFYVHTKRMFTQVVTVEAADEVTAAAVAVLEGEPFGEMTEDTSWEGPCDVYVENEKGDGDYIAL